MFHLISFICFTLFSFICLLIACASLINCHVVVSRLLKVKSVNSVTKLIVTELTVTELTFLAFCNGVDRNGVNNLITFYD